MLEDYSLLPHEGVLDLTSTENLLNTQIFTKDSQMRAIEVVNLKNSLIRL